MHVTAAIVPPPAAMDHLASTLAEIRSVPDEVAWIAPPWRLRLADFGFVVRSDLVLIAEVLTERLAPLPAPEIRFAGLTALPEDEDDSLWVGFGGMVDLLDSLAYRMPGWAHQVGFALDRRSFRRRVRLATVGPMTTVSYLERFEARAAYQGPLWTAGRVVLGAEKPARPGFDAALEPLHVIELGAGSGTTA